MTVVFDTSVLIDILRTDPAAVGYVRGLREVRVSSEVTPSKLCVGCRVLSARGPSACLERCGGQRSTSRSPAERESWGGVGTASAEVSA